MTAQATKKSKSIWDPEIARRATWDSFVKLNPVTLMKNPVMFVVEIGAALLTIDLVKDLLNHTHSFGFEFQITIWLWFTVLFANFAEAMAEAHGNRRLQTETGRLHRGDVRIEAASRRRRGRCRGAIYSRRRRSHRRRRIC